MQGLKSHCNDLKEVDPYHLGLHTFTNALIIPQSKDRNAQTMDRLNPPKKKLPPGLLPVIYKMDNAKKDDKIPPTMAGQTIDLESDKAQEDLQSIYQSLCRHNETSSTKLASKDKATWQNEDWGNTYQGPTEEVPLELREEVPLELRETDPPETEAEAKTSSSETDTVDTENSVLKKKQASSSVIDEDIFEEYYSEYKELQVFLSSLPEQVNDKISVAKSDEYFKKLALLKNKKADVDLKMRDMRNSLKQQGYPDAMSQFHIQYRSEIREGQRALLRKRKIENAAQKTAKKTENEWIYKVLDIYCQRGKGNSPFSEETEKQIEDAVSNEYQIKRPRIANRNETAELTAWKRDQEANYGRKALNELMKDEREALQYSELRYLMRKGFFGQWQGKIIQGTTNRSRQPVVHLLSPEWVKYHFKSAFVKLVQLVGEETDNISPARRWVKIPCGYQSHSDDLPDEYFHKQLPIHYQQGNENLCLFYSTASAFHHMGYADISCSIVDQAFSLVNMASDFQCSELINIITRSSTKYVVHYKIFLKKIHRQQRRQNTGTDNMVLDPLTLSGDNPNSSDPHVIILHGSDGGTGHAITIVDGKVFDSTAPYAMKLCSQVLDWCCNCEGGFERVRYAIRFHVTRREHIDTTVRNKKKRNGRKKRKNIQFQESKIKK